MYETHDLRNKKSNALATMYWSGCAMLGAAMTAVAPVFATTGAVDIFARLKTMLDTIGGKLTGVTTIIAAVLVVFCLLIRMFSRSPRSIESANEWLKRIAISWIAINSLKYIVALLTNLVGTDGTYWSNGTVLR